MQGGVLHPDQIDYIYSIYSGDHGLGKLRFVSKLVVGHLPNKAGGNHEKAMAVYPIHLPMSSVRKIRDRSSRLIPRMT